MSSSSCREWSFRPRRCARGRGASRTGASHSASAKRDDVINSTSSISRPWRRACLRELEKRWSSAKPARPTETDNRAYAIGGSSPKEPKPERPKRESSERGEVGGRTELFDVLATWIWLDFGSGPRDGALVPRRRENARCQIGPPSRLWPSLCVPAGSKYDRRYNDERQA